MRAILNALQEAALNGRFYIAYALMTISASLALVGARLLPKQHPSRTYCIGRVRNGRANWKVALRAPRRTR